MTQATINGNTYSDDGTSAKDMLNGGHRTHFLPMVGDVATVAGVVAGQAAQTAIDAVNATNAANATKGTSTTSLTVAAGTQSITTQSGKQFTAGNFVTVSRTSAPTTLMHGVVTAYSGTALTVDVAAIAGSGTYTDWTIALSGAQGVQGPSGNGMMPYAAKTGAYTVVTTDRGSLIDCTSGTFTLSFQACATLGANWATYIRNSGTGVITLDPSGAETIDGVATSIITAGNIAIVQCDGAALRTVLSAPSRLEPLIGSGVFLPESATSVTQADGSKYLKTNTWVTSGPEMLPLSLNPLASTNYNESKFTQRTSGSVLNFSAAAYGGGLFVVGGPAGLILTSPDGVAWTTQASGIAYTISNLRYANGLFFAMSSGGTFHTSPDGVTWASRTTGSLYGPVDIAWSGSEYMALNGSDQFCAKSSDLITWGTAVNLSTVYPSAVAYGAGLWVMVSNTGAAIRSSPDGTTWTTRTPGTGSGSFKDLFWDGAQFVAWRTNGTYHASSDGITWSTVLLSNVGTVGGYNRIAHDGAGTWAAAAALNLGTYSLRVSLDLAGAVWSSQSCNGLSASTVCAFGGGMIVVASQNGFIASAPSDFSNAAVDIWYGTGAAATNPIGSLYARYK